MAHLVHVNDTSIEALGKEEEEHGGYGSSIIISDINSNSSYMHKPCVCFPNSILKVELDSQTNLYEMHDHWIKKVVTIEILF